MQQARRHALAVALLALVVLAGCQTPVGSADTGTTTVSSATTTTQTTTTETTTQKPASPWGSDTITVAVSTELQDRNYSALARPAIEFWNENRMDVDTAYRNPPRLELTSDVENADVHIQYQPTIPKCDGKSAPRGDGFYSCTPSVNGSSSVDDQVTLTVTGQYTNDTTTNVTLNALGALYGVGGETTPRAIEDPKLLDPFPRTDTVVVGITYIANDDRNITRLVQDAVDYWMEVDDEHGDYQTDWVVKPNAPNPDVQILYVDTIVKCGFGPNHEYYIGCTNLLSTNRSANTPVQVEIAAGYTDNSTVNTIKHEFGHLYGREHGDEPMPLMSATGDAIPLNESNRTSDRIAQPNRVATESG